MATRTGNRSGGVSVHFDETLNTSRGFDTDSTYLSHDDGTPQLESIQAEKVLSIHYHASKGMAGGALYDASTGGITLSPDFRESDTFEFLAQLISESQPTKLLVSAKLPESLLKEVRHCKYADDVHMLPGGRLWMQIPCYIRRPAVARVLISSLPPIYVCLNEKAIA